MTEARYILVAAALLAAAFAPALSFAQADGQVTTSYDSSYEIETPDATKPVTVGLEHHLYSPGEDIAVTGAVWTEILNRVENLTAVTIELKDENGNAIDRQEASLGTNGNFTTSVQLPDNAGAGTYTVESRAEVEGDDLGIIEAITSATLNSSMQFVVAEPAEYEAKAEEQDFQVAIASNSEVDNFVFDQEGKKIAFSVEGEDRTAGVTEVTIPKALLSGEMQVFLDGELLSEQDVILKSDTAQESTFEINYDHSIHEVEVTGTNVIPEFPIVTVVAAASMLAIVGVTVARTRGYLTRMWG